MGRNQKGAARRVALLGVLFALAAVLSLFEGALAGAMGLPPAASRIRMTSMPSRRRLPWR